VARFYRLQTCLVSLASTYEEYAHSRELVVPVPYPDRGPPFQELTPLEDPAKDPVNGVWEETGKAKDRLKIGDLSPMSGVAGRSLTPLPLLMWGDG